MNWLARLKRQCRRCCPGSALAVLLSLVSGVSAAADNPIVAAASDLQFALPEIAARFERDTGRSVRLGFGSSGNLRRQIVQGAPFELYMSADEAHVEALHRQGLAEGGGVVYGIGRLALVSRKQAPRLDLNALRKRLESGYLERLAIANPEHAPYGVAARDVLQHAGLWQAIEPHLVLAENVSQAARFALAAESDGGIVAYSLVLAQPLVDRAHYTLIPEDLHRPLRQRMTLIRGAGDTARAFYAYLQEPEARAILSRYGFSLPERG